MKTTEEPTALPEKLRLVRTHPDEKTRRQLLELVTHDHGQFGSEEALFFCAEDGSPRAQLAHACVDRYNSHAADKAKIKALSAALTKAHEELCAALPFLSVKYGNRAAANATLLQIRAAIATA
jgi:hypothetical protein